MHLMLWLGAISAYYIPIHIKKIIIMNISQILGSSPNNVCMRIENNGSNAHWEQWIERVLRINNAEYFQVNAVSEAFVNIYLLLWIQTPRYYAHIILSCGPREARATLCCKKVAVYKRRHTLLRKIAPEWKHTKWNIPIVFTPSRKNIWSASVS